MLLLELIALYDSLLCSGYVAQLCSTGIGVEQCPSRLSLIGGWVWCFVTSVHEQYKTLTFDSLPALGCISFFRYYEYTHFAALLFSLITFADMA